MNSTSSFLIQLYLSILAWVYQRVKPCAFTVIPRILRSMFLPLSCFSTFVCWLETKLHTCVGDPMHLLLCSIRTFHLEMLGETNSSTLFISRTRSKFCNSQIKRLHQLLFCSSFECHTLPYQKVVMIFISLLMKWCSYTSSLTFTSKLHARGCWVCMLMCVSYIEKSMLFSKSWEHLYPS